MGGPTGLDYGPMFAIMDRSSLTDEQWQEMFDDLRVMEAEAMKVMRERDSG